MADLAELAALHGELEGSSLVDAVGSETFAYRDLVGGEELQGSGVVGLKAGGELVDQAGLALERGCPARAGAGRPGRSASRPWGWPSWGSASTCERHPGGARRVAVELDPALAFHRVLGGTEGRSGGGRRVGRLRTSNAVSSVGRMRPPWGRMVMAFASHAAGRRVPRRRR